MIRKIIAEKYFSWIDRKRCVDFESAFFDAIKNQNYSEETLVALQKELLFRLIRHADRSVQAFKGCFSELEDLNSERFLESFSQLPLLEKKAIIADRELYVSRDYPGKRFSSSTSGSTGTSLVFEYNSGHMAWVEASKWRARGWHGVNRGDKVFILWGRPLDNSFGRVLFDPLKSFIRNESHFNTFNSLGDDYCEFLWSELVRRRPRFVYGYGSSIAELSRYALKKGYKLDWGQAPNFVQYTADHMSESEKKVAASVFGTSIRSDYGGSEIAGIASECSEGNLHISVDHCYLEIVDQYTKRPVEEGEVGEIVVTALHNYRMPLIRYRIGDLGKVIRMRCGCGNPLPIMELVAGKAVDFVNTSFVSRISAHYFDYINIELMKRGLTGIAQFQVIQEERDDFVFKFLVGDLDSRDESLAQFCDLLRQKLGPVSIETIEVTEIPVEKSGKRKYFVKNVKD